MKKTIKKNTLVRLTPKYKKWELKHLYEMYQVNGYISEGHKYIAMFLGDVCGEYPMIGKVVGTGNAGCLKVEWESKLGKDCGYYEQKHLKVVKK